MQKLALICLIVILSAQSPITLSEIMFDPDESEYYYEFVEIFNTSETEYVDLTNWAISDSSSLDFIIHPQNEEMLIEPLGFAVIFDPGYFEQDSLIYDSKIPENTLILTIDGSTFGSGGFSNSNAENVILLDADTTEISRRKYTLDNEQGFSEEKIDLSSEDNSDENWGNSVDFRGTPGFWNSISPKPVDLAIADFSYQFSDETTIEISVTVKNQGYLDSPVAMLKILQNNEQIAIDEIPSLLPSQSWEIAFPNIEIINGNNMFFAKIIIENDENNNSDSLEIFLPFTFGTILVNEFMFQPLSGNAEFIEIYNSSEDAIDLFGWSIRDASGKDATIEEPVFLAQNEYFVICDDAQIFIQFPDIQNALVLDDFPALNNSGDSIFLLQPDSSIVDSLIFSTNWGDQKGVSIEKTNLHLASNFAENWRLCIDEAGGTPGKKNSVVFTEFPENVGIKISPNPFQPAIESTIISWKMPYPSIAITIEIFDVNGRKMLRLLNHESENGDSYVLWDGSTDFGDAPRGLYLVSAEISDTKTGKLHKFLDYVVVAR